MAIVKATYTKIQRNIKASLRYYTHRPNIAGIRGTREIFGAQGIRTKAQVYRMIDGQKRGTYYYRLVLSPDPNSEDLARNINLERMTKRTLARFARRRRLEPIDYAAVAHTDHTDKRHVHVVACFPKKLTRADLNNLRRLATEEALGRERELNQGQFRTTPRSSPRPKSRMHAGYRKSGGVVFLAPGSYPGAARKLCTLCMFPSRLVWQDGRLRCKNCGAAPKRPSFLFQHSRGQEAGLQLSMRGVIGE